MSAPIDLTTRETADTLRRIAWTVGRGSRACAWALSTFGDEHRANVALVTEEKLAWARTGLERASAPSIPDGYAEGWRKLIATFEALLREKAPGDPEPPRALAAWTLERVGLEPDTDPRVAPARKMGVRPAHVLIARHSGGRTARELADCVALASDVFPIVEGWVPTARDEAIREAGTAISTHLAYTSHRYQTQAAGEHRIRRLLALFGDDATLFLNGVRTENGRGYHPLTLHTFDFGMAVVDEARVGIVVRTGED